MTFPSTGRSAGDDYEHGLEHERPKVVPIPLDFSPIREVAITGRLDGAV
jgi:hypothetical protein